MSPTQHLQNQSQLFFPLTSLRKKNNALIFATFAQSINKSFLGRTLTMNIMDGQGRHGEHNGST